ncbi:MAG: methylmalonyl-CoA epimerase [Magnetovibrio sp.]|nr:methylmalonyl-CoA epimerase [Magnetovibrio sp.]|tara:strand:+ start:353 stop:757 length:405 start_codon:yes stop_codon:yes gene_type:complete
MIGQLNHVAIAVPNLKEAADNYKSTLGAKISEPKEQPEHGVTVIFVELPNTKIELLEPLGKDSPLHSFLEKNPSGGIHHLCFEVDDIVLASLHLRNEGAHLIDEGRPRIGAHGKPVLFLHPKDFSGTLIELEEA